MTIEASLGPGGSRDGGRRVGAPSARLLCDIVPRSVEVALRHLPASLRRLLDSKDCQQEVLRVLLERPDRLQHRTDDEIAAWSFGIARRVVAMTLRKRNREARAMEKLAALHRARSRSAEPDRPELREEVNQVLSCACELDRELLWMKHGLGYSLEELSEYSGLRPSAVAKRLERARRRLRRTNPEGSSHFLRGLGKEPP